MRFYLIFSLLNRHLPWFFESCLRYLLRTVQLLIFSGELFLTVGGSMRLVLLEYLILRLWVFGINYSHWSHVLNSSEKSTVVKHKTVEIREMEKFVLEGKTNSNSEL